MHCTQAAHLMGVCLPIELVLGQQTQHLSPIQMSEYPNHFCVLSHAGTHLMGVSPSNSFWGERYSISRPSTCRQPVTVAPCIYTSHSQPLGCRRVTMGSLQTILFHFLEAVVVLLWGIPGGVLCSSQCTRWQGCKALAPPRFGAHSCGAVLCCAALRCSSPVVPSAKLHQPVHAKLLLAEPNVALHGRPAARHKHRWSSATRYWMTKGLVSSA